MHKRVKAQLLQTDNTIVAYADSLRMDASTSIAPFSDFDADPATLSDLFAAVSRTKNKVVVLVPGREFLRLRVTLPTQGGQAEKAIPWLVEPKIASNIETCSMIWQPVDGTDATYEVLVWANAVQAQLDQLFTPELVRRLVIVPVHGLLELESERLVRIDSQIYTITSEGSGVVDNLPDGAALEAIEEMWPWLETALSQSKPVVVSPPEKSALSLPNPWLALVGSFIWGALAIFLFVNSFANRSEAAGLDDASRAMFESTIPGLRADLDLERQVRNRFREISGMGDSNRSHQAVMVVPALGSIAEVLDQQDLSVQTYQYRESQIVFTVNLQALSGVSELQRTLKQAGLDASVRSARQGQDEAIIELVVSL